MSYSKDGKSKLNKEYILHNWKTLKGIIQPAEFARELKISNLLPKFSCENLGSFSRSHQATLVLINVYREIQSSEKYQMFAEILRRHNSTAADALSNCVGGPINKPETVDKHIIEQRDHLKQFGKKIKVRLNRYPEVLLEIIDDFIEHDILDIDTVEDILNKPKESAQLLVDSASTKIHLGAYNRLLETLKLEKNFRGLVSEITTAGVGEDIKTAKGNVQQTSSVSPYVATAKGNVQQTSSVSPYVATVLETASGLALSLSTTPEIPNMYNSLLAQHSPADLAVFKTFGSTIATKKEGSVIFRFATNVTAAQQKIQEGAIKAMIENIITHMDDIDLKEPFQLNVQLRCVYNKKSNMIIAIPPSATLLSGVSALQNVTRTQSEQQKTESVQHTTESVHHTTESVQHTMNETIIAAHRSFLIEELNTMALVRAFKDKGITCFDGLDGTMGRQQRAEDFLTILEENNLLDQLLDILREQDMTYVLDRLNNCRKAYSADPHILRSNISNNRTHILENVVIDDVREIFIEREVFSSSMFDEIEKKYSGSEDQMSIVLIEIINSGPRAMRILVDVLYISHLDSLADSLLRRTPNDMQEMQDNTQIDESSSDGELLYEATYIVSKAVDDSSSESDLLYDASFEVSKSDDNSGVPLFPVDKRDICHDQMNLMTQDDTVTSLEKCSTGSNYQLQSNDLSDDSRTGLMHDKSEDLENVIQDNNPKIKSEHVKFVSEVNQTISDGMKIPEQVPTTDENLTDMSDTEAIDLTPSISQPLLRSNSQSHCLKRQFSKSELLPKISIKPLDGNIKHVKKRCVTTDSEGNLQLFVPPGGTVGSSENSEDNDIGCIPAYSSDEINKGACSNIKFTDIIAKNMTDKAWKDLCQHEAEKGSELTLEQLPQVCAPDTILLLDISGSMKDCGYKELKDAAVDFVNKRIATRTELDLNENIAMVTYGHMTEVRHHLTSDYDIVLKHLDNLPKPGGPSPMIAGLQLCQSVIAARGKISTIGGRQVGGRHVGGSRFHPRIVLITDGNLMPSECIIGNTNLPDLNTCDKEEETLMIEKLYDICSELSNSKTQVVCIPVGCFDKDKLECIANITSGKIVNHKKAASLGNELLKMVYAKQIEEGERSAHELQSKLLSMRTITADDFEDIIDISKNPSKYGIINDDEYDDELFYPCLQSLFKKEKLVVCRDVFSK